jgi:three-Cys-motif partner protein
MSTVNFFEKKREWSKVKDKIVAYYLKPYSAKILNSQKPVKIIDCFAGKGRFGDGEKGSPIIIADTIKEILKNENKNVYKNKKIEACFIEKKYYSELKENTKLCGHCKSLEGSFEEHFNSIINESEDINLFLYIDPYGIKSLSFEIFKTLSERKAISTEFLMNFNSFGFLREGFRLLKYSLPKELDVDIDFEEDEKNSIERMNAIANGDYWQKIIQDKNDNKINMFKAEELFISEYIKQLKKAQKYVLNIAIKVKKEHLPKYRLIFGTNHPEGVKLMLDKMHEAWFELTPKGNGFEYFDQPDYYANECHKTPEKEILNLASCKIHLQDLILNLIDTFGITYKTTDYIKLIQEMSNSPKDLFSASLVPSLRVIREYKTATGKNPTDWDWNNKIFIERIK